MIAADIIEQDTLAGVLEIKLLKSNTAGFFQYVFFGKNLPISSLEEYDKLMDNYLFILEEFFDYTPKIYKMNASQLEVLGNQRIAKKILKMVSLFHEDDIIVYFAKSWELANFHVRQSLKKANLTNPVLRTNTEEDADNLINQLLRLDSRKAAHEFAVQYNAAELVNESVKKKRKKNR